jgi:hypothetical protein
MVGGSKVDTTSYSSANWWRQELDLYGAGYAL